jgi:hypothetical protein
MDIGPLELLIAIYPSSCLDPSLCRDISPTDGVLSLSLPQNRIPRLCLEHLGVRAFEPTHDQQQQDLNMLSNLNIPITTPVLSR